MRMLVTRVVVAFLCSFPLLIHMFGVPLALGLQGVLATIVQWFCGWPFYVGFWAGIRRFRGNMDVLVALGTSAAYFFSFYTIFADPTRGVYFETSSLLITFILLGRLIEEISKRKAEGGMRALLSMQPKTARLKRDHRVVEVEINAVKVGDLVLVPPGERIPIDGVVIEGTTAVDESMLTGESLTVEKQEGSHLFAGTVNQHGSIVAKVSKVGEDTALAHIIHMVQSAQRSKAPIERLADTVSAFFVPAVLVISLITLLVWGIAFGDGREGLISAIAVLVIACPCALGLATPIIILVASAAAANRGILVKNAEAVERAHQIQQMIIDKTNTVTEGTLFVEKMELEEKYFPIVKTLADHSKHPAARAIFDRLLQKDVPSLPQMLRFQAIPGRGVSGYFDQRKYLLGSEAFLEENQTSIGSLAEKAQNEVGNLVFFGTEKLPLGYFVLSDTIKEGSHAAVRALQERGITTTLMSGDRRVVAEKVGQELGFTEVEAEVLPEEKANKVTKAKETGAIVGMVGDGVNDAPALAAADVGFAIASGTDVAMESASVGLMRSDLRSVVEMIDLSKRAKQKIVQNLVFAFGYNTLGIPLAALGFLNPIIAGIAMALSSISVVANALLLKREYERSSENLH